MSEAKKVLVVFYSHSGNTRTIGQAIAEKLGADVEEIVEAKPKTGLIHFVASGFQAKSGAKPRFSRCIGTRRSMIWLSLAARCMRAPSPAQCVPI